MANKIFVSYKDDYEGRIYKNLLVAWSENKNFPEISFYDNSVGTSINSTNAYYIKQVILEKIKKSDVFLCLIGEHTYKSEWVAWEIEKAKELIEKSLDISKAVSQVMKTMSNNLLMTSQSFHEKDVQLENQIDNLQLGNNEGFTLNGPVKQ